MHCAAAEGIEGAGLSRGCIMLKDRITNTLHWLRTLITEPQNELTRWEMPAV